MSIFANLWEQVKLGSSSVFNFLKPFIQHFLEDEVQMLIPLATQAVAAVASDPNMAGKDWDVKLKAAVTQVQTQAIQQGIQVGLTSIINTTQAAVNAAQAKQAATPPAQ